MSWAVQRYVWLTTPTLSEPSDALYDGNCAVRVQYRNDTHRNLGLNEYEVVIMKSKT